MGGFVHSMGRLLRTSGSANHFCHSSKKQGTRRVVRLKACDSNHGTGCVASVFNCAGGQACNHRNL